jgi:SAM-dependent methyltransferase
MSRRPPYVQQDRGDRLRPGPFHRRSWVLKELARQLQEVLDTLPAGTRVLDFGCGSRPYEALLRRRFASYVAADLHGNAAAHLGIDADGRLPGAFAPFDCVLSSQVLEHVVSPELYLAEAHRVLTPRGALVLSTHGIWPYHPDPVDYWRWTAEGLRTLIERAGFDVVQVHSILGPAATVLQFWQDVTLQRLPTFLRTPYVGLMQLAIRAADSRRATSCSHDASIYVVHARRREGVEP